MLEMRGDERRWGEGKPCHTGAPYFTPVTAAAPVSGGLTPFFLFHTSSWGCRSGNRYQGRAWGGTEWWLAVNLTVFSFSLYILRVSQQSLTGEAHRKNKSAQCYWSCCNLYSWNLCVCVLSSHLWFIDFLSFWLGSASLQGYHTAIPTS